MALDRLENSLLLDTPRVVFLAKATPRPRAISKSQNALPLLIGVPRSAETEQVAELAGAGVVGSLLSQGCAKFFDISERHKSDAENRIVSLNTRARVCAWALNGER